MASHFQHMARAIRLARRGQYTACPNPRVGCVLVKNGEVIAEGWHERTGGPHAEAMALARGGDLARSATAYVSLEPCCHHGRTPPCAEALIAAGVSRVVFAMRDPNPRVAGNGSEHLRAAGLDVIEGVMESEARAVNRGFLSRFERHRPWVRLKLAISLDGRTAMASGESAWITGTPARRDVQYLRARADAVMTGVGTVLADDPALNVRLTAAELDIAGPVRQPLRVILDGKLRLPEQAKTLSLPGHVLVYTAGDLDCREKRVFSPSVEVMTVSSIDGSLDLSEIMSDLVAREIGELHLESGPTLAGAMLEAGLVDELVIYQAPHLMGSSARGLADLPGVSGMSDRIELEISDLRLVGRDLRITAVPRPQ